MFRCFQTYLLVAAVEVVASPNITDRAMNFCLVKVDFVTGVLFGRNGQERCRKPECLLL